MDAVRAKPKIDIGRIVTDSVFASTTSVNSQSPSSHGDEARVEFLVLRPDSPLRSERAPR
jgi:hypothetical protein